MHKAIKLLKQELINTHNKINWLSEDIKEHETRLEILKVDLDNQITNAHQIEVALNKLEGE